MNLSKKKVLAAKILKVGKGRVIFRMEDLASIKEAITRQDIKGLKEEGAISIRPIKGRKKIRKRKTRRGPGKIKKKVNNRKQIYVKITRKLRYYLKGLKEKGIVDRELYWNLRNKIRMRDFKSKASFKDYLKSIDINIDKVEKKKGKTETKSKASTTSKDVESTKEEGK